MTHDEDLREQRQALNAALNNRDLETIKSYLHPAFVANQAMVRQMERMLKRVKDFDSQVEVEDIEVSGDRAKLVVRRIEGGRIHDLKAFWPLIATAALFLGLAVVNTVQGHRVNVPVLAEPAFVAEIERVQSHLVNGTIFAVGSLGFVWLAFFVGRRSFHQTRRAQETWRSVDGRWLLAEEEPLF